MKTPGILATFKTMYIEDREEIEYCAYINDLIRKMSTIKGKSSVSSNFYGTSYVYQKDGLRCIYNDSDYGNDNYHFEVHVSRWNNIPAGVNPYIVCDNEGYNLVYSFQDSPNRNVLIWHIPGDWVEILKRASNL